MESLPPDRASNCEQSGIPGETSARSGFSGGMEDRPVSQQLVLNRPVVESNRRLIDRAKGASQVVNAHDVSQFNSDTVSNASGFPSEPSIAFAPC